jgi:hypothetical protein
MSTEISVSNSTQKNCKDLLNIMKQYNQDCRITKTTSIVENKFENGCIVTIETFKDKTHLENLWKNMKINGKYKCAYIKVDNGFSGCINDYINS